MIQTELDFIKRYQPWRLRASVDNGIPADPDKKFRLMFAKPGQKMRHMVIARDGKRCRYCGVVVYEGRRKKSLGKKTMLVIDHVYPRNRGGTNNINNLVVACKACDDRKGPLTLEEAGMTLLVRCPSCGPTMWTMTSKCVKCGRHPRSSVHPTL